MGTITLVAPSEVRRSRGGVLALVIAASLGLGAALGAFLAAYRTDHAYPEHVRRARMADLVINPSLTTVDSDRVIRSLPHVRELHSYELTYAGYFDRAHVRTLADVLRDNRGNTYGSSDGHYLDTDRLIVQSGSPPTGPREVFVTQAYRRELTRRVGRPLHVGDRLPIGFLWSAVDIGIDDPTKVPVEPIGVEQLRISGFGRLAGEVLDDPLYRQEELVLSPDVARRYDCPPARIPDSQDPDVLLSAVFPRDCAVSYRYYALRLDDPGAVRDVARLAQRRLLGLNRALWTRVGDANSENLAYYPVVTTRLDADARVRSSVRPTVVALRIFGWVALLATLVVVGLGASRLTRDAHGTDEILRALGARGATRWSVRVLPTAVGTAAGVVGAVVVGIALSPIGPVGEVARTRAHRTWSAPAAVVGPFVAGTVAALALLLVVVGLLAGRRPPGPARVRRFRAIRSPEIADGVTAAFATGRALLLPAAAAVAITAVTATVVFASDLGRVVDAPARYGWPWRIGVLTGSGYGDTDVGAVRTTLASRDGITHWDAVGVESATVDGRPVPVLTSDGPVALTVVSGRLARRPGELTLGRQTAEDLDVGVGAQVRLGGGPGRGTRRARVVGIVVLPAIGQFLSDRTGLGRGAIAVVTPVEQRANTTFTGIRLRRGVATADELAAIRTQIPGWTVGEPPRVFTDAVRPPEIVNADAMRAAPAVLAALLALAMLAALGLALASSVNGRRHHYAVLRVLGFRRGQVARSVRWQALATMAAGVVAGIPAGIVTGRALWRAFARELGLGSGSSVPVGLLTVVTLVALLGALLAAVVPARRAARRAPARALTTQ